MPASAPASAGAAGSGGCVAVIAEGARVAALAFAPDEESVLFANPELERIAGAGVSPVDLHAFSNYRVQEQEDPGEYRLAAVSGPGGRAVRLSAEPSLVDRRDGGVVRFWVERTVALAPLPLPDLPAGVRYAGYQSRSTVSLLEVSGGSAGGKCVGLWHLLQVPAGSTDFDIGMWDAYLGALGEHVQVVAQGDDVGMQDREYVSPELYRKFIFPWHKRLYDFIHSKTQAKVLMHSCGSIRKLVPSLIEAGVDALNPVQYSAAHMELAGLKREFGSELSFWGGGMDTQHALLGPGVTPQSIERDVRRNLEILMKGGGFVFSATHNIQHEIPPETTLKVYDAAVARRRHR